VIALLVNQALFLKDDRQAVAFAEAGPRTAGRYISPVLATDLNAMQAKAFARMGDVADAHREQAAARAGTREEPPQTGIFSPASSRPSSQRR
jgi:hypothetical protein